MKYQRKTFQGLITIRLAEVKRVVNLNPICVFACLCLVLSAAGLGRAQGPIIENRPQSATVTTVAGSSERLRFAAPGTITRMQLQIYSELGQLVFDASSKGNVLDWTLQDAAGQRLDNGSYLCVVTVKNLSGRLSQRIGSVTINEKGVGLQPIASTALTPAQQQAIGPIEENAALTVLKAGEAEAATVIAHNGSEGQIVRSGGALSFRLGDFFSGKDKEQMRLTEEGNLGIGTSEPKFKLDVAGAIRAREGLVFNNGSTLNVNDKGALTLTDSSGNITPNAAGTGTLNKVAKWAETGGNGNLTDSSIFDNGNVGIGTTNPATKLDLVGTLTLRNTVASPGFKVGDRVSAPGTQMVYASAPGSAFSVLNTFVQGSTLAAPRIAQFSNWTSDIDLDPNNATQFLFGHFPAQGGVIGTVAYGTATAKKISIQPNWNGSSTPTALVVDTNSNVGIGTIAPQSLLDVAGDVNTSTQYNISGNRVLSVSGTTNLFAGVDAGLNNTTGNNNSFVGFLTGFNNTTGNLNSFFGIGAGAGNTTENNNTFLGAVSNGAAGITNATAIGANAQVTQSNSLVLGSINGVNNATADTKVGIGTTAPLSKLDLRGDLFIGLPGVPDFGPGNNSLFVANDSGDSNNSFRIDGFQNDLAIIARSGASSAAGTSISFRTSTAAGGETDRVRIQPNGNVGIGETNPSAKLQVTNGDIYTTTIGTGLILKSLGGSCFRVQVSNGGALSAASISCP